MENSNKGIQAYFVALTPDYELEAKVAIAKLGILTRFGNQTYLPDPPHCTLYVALTENLEEVKKRLEQIASESKSIKLEVANDWQEFKEDKLAGGGTSLALKFREQDKSSIIALQKRVVNDLNELRQNKIHPRYKGIELPQPLKESVEKYGYPFVSSLDQNPILIPHINLCAFNSPEYAEEFKKITPISEFTGPSTLNRLSLYRVYPNDKTELIRHFKLIN